MVHYSSDPLLTIASVEDHCPLILSQVDGSIWIGEHQWAVWIASLEFFCSEKIHEDPQNRHSLSTVLTANVSFELIRKCCCLNYHGNASSVQVEMYHRTQQEIRSMLLLAELRNYTRSNVSHSLMPFSVLSSPPRLTTFTPATVSAVLIPFDEMHMCFDHNA